MTLQRLDWFPGNYSLAGVPSRFTTPEGARVSRAHEESVDSSESITKPIFPGAPQKTQSIDCFRGFNHRTSVNRVVQKCGSPESTL